jgi:hypothetical protein
MLEMLRVKDSILTPFNVVARYIAELKLPSVGTALGRRVLRAPNQKQSCQSTLSYMLTRLDCEMDVLNLTRSRIIHVAVPSTPSPAS